MKKVRVAQAGGAIGETVFIDEEGKMDAGIVAEHAGVIRVGQADGGKIRASRLNLVFVFAQLRDVLTAEDSTVMAQKHDYGGLLFPQRAEADLEAIGVGQDDGRQRLAQGHRFYGR